jgi:hypothetical protein
LGTAVSTPTDKKYRFSGHQTFAFRHSWLEKGARAVEACPTVFLEDDALVRLGVGKNMVDSSSAQNGEYIVTPTGRRVLHQLTEGLEDRSPYRAWTITGPYGVGKSAFGVFVTRLLCSNDGSGASALRKLAEADPARARELERFRRNGGGQKLLYPLLITARRAPASVCLLEAVLSSAAQVRGHGAAELSEKAKSLLRAAAKGAVLDSREVAACVAALSDLMVRKGHAGLLVLIDELGKLFEYAAYRPQRGDVFVLQELAEQASRSGLVPMLILGFLHQSFEEYGRHLDTVSRNEWAKIQGRFQDVAFLEPPEQVIRMIGAAIKWRSGGMPPALRRQVKQLAEQAVRCGVCPRAMRPDEFEQVCEQAYPLHPVSLVALPHLYPPSS